MANAPGFGDAPLAAIKGSKIHLKLKPLLSGEVEMDTVVLEGVNANLVTLANGKTNWEFAGSETAADKGALKSLLSHLMMPEKHWLHWPLAGSR